MDVSGLSPGYPLTLEPPLLPPIPCLVSLNSSSEDLNESVYYMLIPMQHISVLRIFSSFCIPTKHPIELHMQNTML